MKTKQVMVRMGENLYNQLLKNAKDYEVSLPMYIRLILSKSWKPEIKVTNELIKEISKTHNE